MFLILITTKRVQIDGLFFNGFQFKPAFRLFVMYVLCDPSSNKMRTGMPFVASFHLEPLHWPFSVKLRFYFSLSLKL